MTKYNLHMYHRVSSDMYIMYIMNSNRFNYGILKFIFLIDTDKAIYGYGDVVIGIKMGIYLWCSARLQ